MSRKARKKKRLDENGEKPPEDLLDYFDKVPTVLILGQYIKRIPHEGVKDCEGCHTLPSVLHFTACPKEQCPWCFKASLTCTCESDILRAETDLFVERIVEDEVGS